MPMSRRGLFALLPGAGALSQAKLEHQQLSAADAACPGTIRAPYVPPLMVGCYNEHGRLLHVSLIAARPGTRMRLPAAGRAAAHELRLL